MRTHEPASAIVVPCFNEESRIDRCLEGLRGQAEYFPRPFDVVVVDDGSSDGTCVRVQAWQRDWPELHLVQFPKNTGKGHAIKAGALHSRAPRVLFSDVDLSTPLSEAPRLFEALDGGAGLAVGSRRAPGARIQVDQSPLRQFTAQGFILLRKLILPSTAFIADTQCGFKAFTRECIERVASLSRIQGFSFDVELIFLARHLGFRVAEIPVVWEDDADSRVSLLQASSQMARDLVKIRWSLARGCYGPPGL